jgi:hypothetical protein
VPHDSQGLELKAGDRVALVCVVQEVFPTETACNANFRAVPPPGAEREHPPCFACNTKLVTRLPALPDPSVPDGV